MNNLFIQIVYETWMILVMAGPYILFGFLMAGLIHTFVSPAKIVTLLGQRNWKSVLMASVCGVPLPLCSCSVLPTAAALRQKGASRGATTSFLISTPETGVDSIVMTYGIMDLTMAILRPLAAFITASVSGICVNLWGGPDEPPQKPTVSSCCHCSPKSENSRSENESHPAGNPPKRAWWLETIRYGFWDLSNDLSHWLALGLVLSGIISACIPDTFFQGWAGQGVSSLLLMLTISMPMYICASGSTPIAAVMVAKGLSPGAALVFLLAGPATNIGSVPVLLKMLGRRATVLYLLSIFLVTFLIGLAVNQYYSYSGVSSHMAIHTNMEDMNRGWGLLSALILLVLLLKGWIVKPIPGDWKNLNDRMERWIGFRLTWTIVLFVGIVLAALSFFWPSR